MRTFRTRLAGLVAAFALVSSGLAAMPRVAHADPSGTTNATVTWLGSDNPSGKIDHRTGRPLARPANHTTPVPQVAPHAATPAPECPPTVHCVFIPAAYQQNSSVYDYGNYDQANRPADGIVVNREVWHDIEGGCPDAISAFQDPLYYVSAHYLICQNSDGSAYVVQMVRLKDIAWHAGNYDVNMHSVGFEIAGFAASGSGYSPQVYYVASEMGKYVAAQEHIALTTGTIIGHEEVPPPNAANVPAMHMDPGPFFDWSNLYARMGVPVYQLANPLTSKVVVVAPVFQLNKQPVTGCFPDEPGQCANTSSQPTSLVYLRTAASQSAPYLNDPLLNAGTTATDLGNNGAKAYYGQRFVLDGQPQLSSDLSGLWYKVYYAGTTGWIFSAWTNPTVFGASGQYITPKAGQASIPVYGRAYPSPSAYPADFTGYPSVVTLPYSILADQKYAVAITGALTQWYNNDTINGLVDKTYDPYDHVVFTDTSPANQYVVIQYNGREAYVKLTDVDLAG